MLPTVGHAQDSRTSVFELEVLVSKLVTVDTLASRTVVVGEVALLLYRTRGASVSDATLKK
jgi:hypothetical protein